MFAGGIATSVQDTGGTMGCFQGKGNLSIKSVKGHTEVDQFGNPFWSFIDQDTYGLFIAQTITGGYGIPEVKLWRVTPADGSRNASLGVSGIAVVNTAFGYDQHASLRFCQQGSI